ncbi:MAG TPA: GNAT family N-acetyltransferase [Ideonella sp.]|uniref:GNAT family N-acetyltransferase n=1 Tax=Ideonella sp. TaxID=1929293 RepID=UPI002C49F8BC|nr:GNAT family N-acetyltransferase [Ideonella sp.]HSI46940.1 GNAT family N-acetyltransferase [Ideonella sp.]
MTPVLQRLAPAHAAAYRQLMLQAYTLHPEAFTSTAAERAALPLGWWEARLAQGDAPGELVIGAFVDGQLAGVAGLAFEAREKTRHKATLYGMYVPAAARQRGLGRQLVEAVLAQARARPGVRQVQLTVSEGNAAAQALYRRCGFVPFGTEPMAVSVAGGFVAKVHMAATLQQEQDPPRIATTCLRPLPPEHFASYREAAIANYAEQNLRAGRVTPEQALPQAQADFALLLPQGLATPDHFFLEILATENGPLAGWLWWAIEDRGSSRSAFVYDLMILPPARRRGHAKAALKALEAVVQAHGRDRIGLHVFGFNRGAQALYAALGYGVTGLNMAKQLCA